MFVILWLERDKKGKYSVLFSRKGLKDAVIVEGLNRRQVEQIYSLLKAFGIDTFFKGKLKDLELLNISEEAKVPIDQRFKTFNPLKPWEVWD